MTEALRAGSPIERILMLRAATGTLAEIRKRAESANVPVRMVPRAELDRAAPGLNHQGVVALTGRFSYSPLKHLLAKPSPALLFLDGVMDPHNLGSLLRSADGAGFDGVIVPARRAVGVTATVRRVSAGAADVVPVARVSNLGNALDEARSAGLWILGLDASSESDIYDSMLTEPPVGIVCGAEDRGLSPSVRKRCDEVVRIPHQGRLDSLNVSVAGAIAMFEVARRRRT